MLPVIILLAGLMTAGASESDASIREEALRQRLGLGGKKMWLRTAPMPGGVTIWAWSDGARIVRMIADYEVKMALKLFDEHLEHASMAEEAVEAEGVDGRVLVDPDTSVFAYLDVNNRIHAFFTYENQELIDLAGLGDEGEISFGVVRSRVYQFLRDHGVDELDTHAKAMWHSDVKVPSGLIASVDEMDARIAEHGWSESAHQGFFDSVSAAHGPYVRDYVRAYYDLNLAVAALADHMERIDHLESIEPISVELLNELDASDQIQDIADRLDIDTDLIQRALQGGPDADEALEEARDAGFHPSDELRRLIQDAIEELSWGEPLSDLDSAAEEEAENLNIMLDTHDVRAQHHSGGRMSYELHVSNADSVQEAVLPDLHFKLSERGYVPSWVAQGHRDMKKRPGFLRALQEAGYLQTATELYDLAPEEIVWEWPGAARNPGMEALIMLGTIELDPRMDLGEFLEVSYDQGLLTPDQIAYWRVYLQSSGREDRPPMATP